VGCPGRLGNTGQLATLVSANNNMRCNTIEKKTIARVLAIIQNIKENVLTINSILV